MGFNCNHGQFLNMNKEWIRWCWGKFCLLCVLILCGFPFRLSQCEDKEGDFINYPKSLPLLFGSFFFMSVSFSHRFPSSVVDLSELCPIHLWQWLCLWYKQSISFTHTVRNLGCCVFFFFSLTLWWSVVCVSYSFATKRLIPQNGNMNGKMALPLGREIWVYFNHSQSFYHDHKYFHVMITLGSLSNFLNIGFQIKKSPVYFPKLNDCSFILFQ